MDSNSIFDNVMSYSSRGITETTKKVKKSDAMLEKISSLGFNMTQLEDVIRVKGNQLIISIAGSGKTTALIFKIAYDITTGEATRLATVNGNNITIEDFKVTLALNKIDLESKYGSTVWETEVEDGVKFKDTFKNRVLKGMIDVEAVCEEAKKDGLTPSEEEIDKAFDELNKNLYANENYKKILEDLKISDTCIKSQVEKTLTIQKYTENFDKNLKISDEEMKKYYEEHKVDYYKDEVKASHILISTVDDNGKELSEAKKKEAKKKAEEVLKKAKSGEEFSELAKEYSDDPGSAANGGDLGYFTKGQMVQPFEEAAFSLKSGEISGLVESEYGYHIIKVYDKIDKQLTFDEVKDEIKKTLTEDKYMESIEAITKKAKVEKNESVIKKVKF